MKKTVRSSPESFSLLSPSHQTLSEQMESWLLYLAGKNYSARTQEAYRERIVPFVKWCALRGIVTAVQISLPVLERYQRYLVNYRKANGQRLTAGGIVNRLSAIKGLMNWHQKSHLILYNPAQALEMPKVPPRLPSQILSEAEVRQVMSAQPAKTATELRNRAILEVYWSTGMRRIELSGLMLHDLDSERGVVLIREGKGGKPRVVPVGERALLWVERYLEHARGKLTYKYDSGHLFVTFKGGQMSKQVLTHIAGDAIREKAKVDKPGACHVFRHSMATQMLENGADTREIQAILGHEKLETTQLYTRVAIGHLQKVHKRTHPAERKAKAKKK